MFYHVSICLFKCVCVQHHADMLTELGVFICTYSSSLSPRAAFVFRAVLNALTLTLPCFYFAILHQWNVLIMYVLVILVSAAQSCASLLVCVFVFVFCFWNSRLH